MSVFHNGARRTLTELVKKTSLAPAVTTCHNGTNGALEICNTVSQIMGWNRRQGKAYFYTSYRDIHGRVRTKYIGTGATAQAVASGINKSRQDRKQQYTDRLKARQQFDELNKLIKPIEQEATSVIRAAMLLAGFRAYPGGRWRRRRRMQEVRQQTPELKTLGDAIEAAESGDSRG